jgi:hypothetical protein
MFRCIDVFASASMLACTCVCVCMYFRHYVAGIRLECFFGAIAVQLFYLF